MLNVQYRIAISMLLQCFDCKPVLSTPIKYDSKYVLSSLRSVLVLYAILAFTYIEIPPPLRCSRVSYK